MKIICIGMNYSEHVRELPSVWDEQTPREAPREPVFFIKPDTALLRNNDPFYLPDFSQDVQYECELVVRINRLCKGIEERFAHRCYEEVGLGIDFTARDLQRRCKTEGLPWEIAKGFDHSAAIAPVFVPKAELPDIQNIHFSMDLNSERKQTGCTGDMIFSVDRIIAYVSQFVTLRIGDLLFTGTPVGVGQVHIGDRITAELEGRPMLDFQIK
ncbi:fumarylacetoacetate hydrolase family protein [uncultured Rikenella sp.]|uniref:fumarylacetoacetate hydrolase family protein n=1 Tax=uncultured Rikenella sp. TaxID=368003 RepID=UPI00272A506C|nr:fumarylacetoacetate hydrolase family protein [uncultured Rikenella sp.]